MATNIKDKIVEIVGNFDVGQRIRKGYVFSVIKQLNPDGKKILDAGSGAGDYIFSLAVRYQKSQFIGIELEPEKIKQCELKLKKQKFKNIKFVWGDVVAPIQNSFGIIYSVDVLELDLTPFDRQGVKFV